jgi:hypothetical protein
MFAVDGPKVTDTFYENLIKMKASTGTDLQQTHADTSEAAQALHIAIAKLHDEGVSFARWVPFIHLGV